MSYQMLREESKNGKPGKWSSKRIWGTILLGLATLMTVAGGFEFYNPIESLVSMMFITGAGLLGISVFKKS